MHKATKNEPLQFHNDERIPCHRLPFVGTGIKNPGLAFWNVPETGGYTGGCRTGEALALLYMKHLREHGPGPGGMLQNIAFSMFGDRPDNDAVNGQVVGFFRALEKMWFSACRQNRALDDFKAADLLEAANAGLNFDEEAFLASLSDDEDDSNTSH